MQRTGILESPEMPREETRPIHLDHQIGEFALGELEPGQLFTELLPCQRVVSRRLVTGAGSPDHAEENAVAGLVQTTERTTQSPGLGKYRIRGQPDLVEYQ